MNAPAQQPAPNETITSHLPAPADDFDHWARIVRQQMLHCLQKRAGRQRFTTMRPK